jgi:hypothetical protein
MDWERAVEERICTHNPNRNNVYCCLEFDYMLWQMTGTKMSMMNQSLLKRPSATDL